MEVTENEVISEGKDKGEMCDAAKKSNDCPSEYTEMELMQGWVFPKAKRRPQPPELSPTTKWKWTKKPEESSDEKWKWTQKPEESSDKQGGH